MICTAEPTLLDRAGRVLAVLAAIGGAAAAAALSTAPAAGAPAPGPAASASVPAGPAPIQIILPTPAASTPSSSIGPKDFFVPAGTLLAAGLGFGGALLGARLAANAQDRRSRMEAEIKRQQEEKARVVKRLEAFAEQANGLFRSAAAVATAKAEAWTGGTSDQRDQLRLSAAQVLGASHLLDPGLATGVRDFITSIMEICNAPSAAQARNRAQRCAATFEALMAAIGRELRTPETVGEGPPALATGVTGFHTRD